MRPVALPNADDAKRFFRDDSFLGLFESCVTPSFALVTSQWYRKREQGAC